MQLLLSNSVFLGFSSHGIKAPPYLVSRTDFVGFAVHRFAYMPAGPKISQLSVVTQTVSTVRVVCFEKSLANLQQC